jgi:hypothetical protein
MVSSEFRGTPFVALTLTGLSGRLRKGTACYHFCYPTSEYRVAQEGIGRSGALTRTEQDQLLRDESSLLGIGPSELAIRLRERLTNHWID